MKLFYLIITLLWSSLLFSQSVISATESILFSKKEITKNIKDKKFNKFFLMQNSENQPFVALSVVLKNAKKDVNFFIKYKINKWSEWQTLTEDIHLKEEDNIYMNLFYLPQNVTEVEIYSENYKSFKNIEFHFFYPEFTKNTTKNVEYSSSKSLSISCSCPIPAHEGRLDWCPSGSCPAQTSPTYTTVTHLIVHHSAGSNTSSDWAATVRGIWNYHVNVRGWSDIGYNYLIDPNGIIYEGRGDNVLGAHFSAMNGATMGVCLLGDYQSSLGNGTPSTAMVSALVELLSWKECDLSKDPLLSSYHSASSQNLMHVAGHQDAGTGTLCPGDNVYTLLPSIRTSCSSYMQNCSFTTDADLVVSVLNTNPSVVIENQNTELVFAVGNGGSADVVETININLRLNGNLVQSYTIDSIYSGEVIHFSYPNYIFSSLGNHSLCLYISNASNETNFANNSFCRTIEVQTEVVLFSDLIVNSISSSVATPAIDEEVNYEFKIKNIGDESSSENVQGKISVDGTTKQLFNIPILNINEVFIKTYTSSFSTEGNKEVCLELNSPTNETDSGNNTNCKITIVLAPNSIKKLSEVLEFDLYPNPSSKSFTINISLKVQKDIELNLYNNLGKKIYSNYKKNAFIFKEIVNTERLSKGIYYIDILIDGNSYKEKIIIK